MPNGSSCGVLRDAGVKEHLEQHVAEFLAQLLGVATTNGVEQLVGFLE